MSYFPPAKGLKTKVKKHCNFIATERIDTVHFYASFAFPLKLIFFLLGNPAQWEDK